MSKHAEAAADLHDFRSPEDPSGWDETALAELRSLAGRASLLADVSDGTRFVHAMMPFMKAEALAYWRDRVVARRDAIRVKWEAGSFHWNDPLLFPAKDVDAMREAEDAIDRYRSLALGYERSADEVRRNRAVVRTLLDGTPGTAGLVRKSYGTPDYDGGGALGRLRDFVLAKVLRYETSVEALASSEGTLAYNERRARETRRECRNIEERFARAVYEVNVEAMDALVDEFDSAARAVRGGVHDPALAVAKELAALRDRAEEIRTDAGMASGSAPASLR